MPRVARSPTSTVQQADDKRSLDLLRRAARKCRACPLWKPATQTVFGEGPEAMESERS